MTAAALALAAALIAAWAFHAYCRWRVRRAVRRRMREVAEAMARPGDGEAGA